MFGRKRFRKADLPSYDPNLELVQLFKEDNLCQPRNLEQLRPRTCNAFNRLAKYQNNEFELFPGTYQDILGLLTETEDSHVQIKLQPIRLINKRLERRANSFHDYKLHFDVLNELPQEAGEGDYVLLRTMEDVEYEEEKDIRLSIAKVHEKYLEVRTSEHYRKQLEETKYEVKFRKDRTVFRFEQHAIQNLEQKVIDKVLFPQKCGEAADPKMPLEWIGKSVRKNPEQQQAVRNIVNGSSYPAPYILFGPPGTGKTTTLVEAIAQVWKEKPSAKILVCASSNFACNEIMMRLLDLDCVPVQEMFRYLSRSQLRKVDTIDERIVELSNICKNTHQYEIPTIETLKNYRIVFLTLVTAGRLTLLEMGKAHFDYIFIDEAGSATEATTIIPIAGLVSSSSFYKRNHVIIAGDPKQLGPVICHRSAEKLKYGRSMLDRLMELDLYKPDAHTKRYNAACLTKLLQNFRSHKNILDIPNKLFYDSELLAMARPEVTDIALGQPFLPNAKIPIIFHSVYGETLKEADNPSLFNLDECRVVLSYLQKVLQMKCSNGEKIEPHEIGVISPYRRQCMELTRMIRIKFKLTSVEVGTVEQFQGQERKVIIFSTVRSKTETIGFLSNPKRLNVSITRAKALLIIIGNPETLQLDRNWYKLIKYCVDNKVYKGAAIPLKSQARRRLKKDKRAIRTIPVNNDSLNNNDDRLSKTIKNMTISDNEPKSEQKPSYKILMHYKEDIPSSSSASTSITENDSEDETTADLNDDTFVFVGDQNLLTDDENDDPLPLPSLNASEDVLTSDDENISEDEDEQSTNEPKNESNGIFDFDVNFEQYGFVM